MDYEFSKSSLNERDWKAVLWEKGLESILSPSAIESRNEKSIKKNGTYHRKEVSDGGHLDQTKGPPSPGEESLVITSQSIHHRIVTRGGKSSDQPTQLALHCRRGKSTSKKSPRTETDGRSCRRSNSGELREMTADAKAHVVGEDQSQDPREDRHRSNTFA